VHQKNLFLLESLFLGIIFCSLDPLDLLLKHPKCQGQRKLSIKSAEKCHQATKSKDISWWPLPLPPPM
jgi:hypothetical protein